HDFASVPRPDDGLCPLPQPQIRSPDHARLLPHGRDLQSAAAAAERAGRTDPPGRAVFAICSLVSAGAARLFPGRKIAASTGIAPAHSRAADQPWAESRTRTADGPGRETARLLASG